MTVMVMVGRESGRGSGVRHRVVTCTVVGAKQVFQNISLFVAASPPANPTGRRLCLRFVWGPELQKRAYGTSVFMCVLSCSSGPRLAEDIVPSPPATSCRRARPTRFILLPAEPPQLASNWPTSFLSLFHLKPCFLFDLLCHRGSGRSPFLRWKAPHDTLCALPKYQRPPYALPRGFHPNMRAVRLPRSALDNATYHMWSSPCTAYVH